ncbi:pseudouridine-5'-phosphate glycosidase [Labrys sp. KNU-23]|uniref:pseudouridine-5'-phosphate glycosidase n=1 Tax=Labrys sp. KNU-23 TaxID=2789216 RepID=UPI0011EEED12|nr:pseudouridine-5'-phosphate glycosidase [Labrys sp. KNU-23]QEN89897.1 pseudouridine-5'-phosphate glycosidase [Labrys sp. KNU-23]
MTITHSAAVSAALKAGKPVVALESTIITHGMPWPQNVETARKVEAAVRAGGAEPATIAVLDGVIHAGLEDSQLEAMGKATGFLKLSRADLGYAIATGKNGSTTVAATMIAADRAGIHVFATGGIGGVHRGVEKTYDISADLQELARTPVCVVCAGAKAILDIPKTLETLETLGVPVVGYGSDEFPAFWSRKSGLAAPIRLDDPADIAALIRARAELRLDGGVLVGNPIPLADEIAANEINPAIEAAVDEADAMGISGKALTPFLLSRMLDLTEGRSLIANIALVENNARLAAKIAAAL